MCCVKLFLTLISLRGLYISIVNVIGPIGAQISLLEQTGYYSLGLWCMPARLITHSLVVGWSFMPEVEGSSLTHMCTLLFQLSK